MPKRRPNPVLTKYDETILPGPNMVTPDALSTLPATTKTADHEENIVSKRKYKNIWQCFLDIVKPHVYEKGLQFDQWNAYASRIYKDLDADQKDKLHHHWFHGQNLEYDDLFCPNEDGASVRERLFKALFDLFQANQEIQRKWWSVDAILVVINMMAAAPGTDYFRANSASFQAVDVARAIRKALGSDLLLETRFGAATDKKYFYFKTCNRNGTRHYFYIDLQDGQKTVPRPTNFDNIDGNWMDLEAVLHPDVLEMMNSWYSVRYEKVFCPTENESCREAVQAQLKLLEPAINDPVKMKALIYGLDPDGEAYLLSREVTLGEITKSEDGTCEWFRYPSRGRKADIDNLVRGLQKVTLFVAHALRLVLMDSGFENGIHWKEKCAEATKQLNAVGITYFTDKSGNPVVDWYTKFREDRMFPNPLLKHGHYGPPLLVHHPELVLKAREFGEKDLDNLKGEAMRDHFHNVLLPDLCKEMQNNVPAGPERQKITVESILEKYGLVTLCTKTINSWMHYMGFKRALYKKGCYTDIHNKPENVEANFDYCLECLTKWDVLSACWVQLPLDRVKELQRNNIIVNGYMGYQYTSEDGIEMCEFHVDDINKANELPELQGVCFGGFLSVQKDKFFPAYIGRQVLGWGHDEVVSNEKAHNANCWVGHDGQHPLRPKDLGATIHLSAFENRQVGWYPKPTAAQLQEVNKRREGKRYFASDQAKRLYGDDLKRDLDSDEGSFFWSKEPGANRDGYWNLANVAIQFENLADVCDVMYPNEQFLHVASLDNSANHGGKRIGSLDANTMNKGYGGEQGVPDPVVLSTDGCFGKWNGNKKLPRGSTQTFKFEESDNGPGWMSPDEQKDKKYPKILDETRKRRLTKLELIDR